MSAADIRPTCPKCHGTGRVAEVAPVGGLDEMIAAAEERGRRRGVEEGFRQGVENAAQWLKISEPLRLAMHRALSDRVALAPRDSGKEDGPLDKMKRALEQKTRMERERYESFCEAVAAGSPEDRALAMATDADADEDRK